MKSVMTHDFSRIPSVNIPRSSFDRSHGYKTTFDAGYLIPFYCDEALPGDTFNLRMTGFARMTTPIFPVMDNMFMETFFFAVPIRLIWDNFQKFMGEQVNPGDSTDYLVPQIVATPAGHAAGTVADYFGIPTVVPNLAHSALWHRAYALIYNEWFRDQNLQNSLTVNRDDGPDAIWQLLPVRRGKRHDYFTGCLPWPQKGGAVSLPLGITAPIVPGTTGIPIFTVSNNLNTPLRSAAGSTVVNWDAATGGAASALWQDPQLLADLTNATAATINQLRQAFQIQKLLERDARGGTRYVELIKAHFGVTSPDFRLQRPEYLGGGSSPVHMNSVAVTNKTAATGVYPGQLGAYSTTVLNGHGFTKSFTEHCVLLGLVNVRADLTYQQGLNRMFSRNTRYDFYWPELAQIGEQAVLNKEIFAQGTAADTNAFGYQERYAEYRYKPSMVTGLFRSNHAASLDVWHLSQDFAALPVLNASFIEDNPPLDRVIWSTTEPHFIFDSYIRLRCARPMPMFGVPGFIDHF